MSKIVYDHIKYLPQVGNDWRAHHPPESIATWERFMTDWSVTEKIIEMYNWDIFKCEEDNYLRDRLKSFRHNLLFLAGAVMEEVNGPGGGFGYYTDLISQADVSQLIEKDAAYGSSWKRRGGVGAFMMMCRKWDRLEQQIKQHGFDLFKAMVADRKPEGIHDDVGDLRRYLLLIEAEIVARSHWIADNCHPRD